MGSWFNEIEYLKKSNKKSVSFVKFKLVFRLRYCYEGVSQFVEKITDSYSDYERRRSSFFDPDQEIKLETEQFSKIFKDVQSSVREISTALNSSTKSIIQDSIEKNMIVLLYYETVYNFLKLRYKMYPTDFIQLLSLKLRIDFGEYEEEKEEYIITNYKAIFPLLQKDVSDEIIEHLKESVLSIYKELQMSSYEAMQRFIHYCGKFDNFFAEQYPLKLYHRDDQKNENFYNIPDSCYISLNISGVIILDEDFDVKQKFTFKDILKWGYSEKLFVLIIEEEEEDFPIKISFKTRMASNIVYGLNSICNLKKGKLPDENQLQMNRNVTREITENKFFKRVSKFPVLKYYID